MENIYHFGMIVADLDAAMNELGAQLCIEWAPPFRVANTMTRPDGSGDSFATRIAYSRQGPPYLELIEGVADPASIMTITGGPRFHHVGIYAERWRDETARLQGLGMTLEATGSGLAFLRSAVGLSVEVVSFKGRDYLTRILEGRVEDPA